MTTDATPSPVALSVVMTCLNAADTLPRQLEALSRQRWRLPWEVVLVDNGSTDDTVAVAERYRDQLPQLTIVAARDRHSTGYGLNVGARAASGEAIAICDGDDEVADGWVAAMGEALQTHPFVAGRFDVEKLNHTWASTARECPQSDGLGVHEDWPELPHAGGGNLGINRTLFFDVGGFDEELLALMDTDLCWRVQLAGTPLYWERDALVHVRFRENLRGTYRQARSYAQWSVALYHRFRPLGMPALPWQRGLRRWAGLGLSALRLVREPRQLPSWVWNLGWRMGRLRGSMQYRVWAL